MITPEEFKTIDESFKQDREEESQRENMLKAEMEAAVSSMIVEAINDSIRQGDYRKHLVDGRKYIEGLLKFTAMNQPTGALQKTVNSFAKKQYLLQLLSNNLRVTSGCRFKANLSACEHISTLLTDIFTEVGWGGVGVDATLYADDFGICHMEMKYAIFFKDTVNTVVPKTEQPSGYALELKEPKGFWSELLDVFR